MGGGLSREEVEQAGFRRKGRRGEKEIADDESRNIRARQGLGGGREGDRQRGNWEIETEPALSDVGKKDAIRDTIGDSLDAHEYRDSGDVSSRSGTIVFVASIKKKKVFRKGNRVVLPSLIARGGKRSVEEVFTACRLSIVTLE